MELEKKRTIYIFKNYFTDFIAEQKEEVKNKLYGYFESLRHNQLFPKNTLNTYRELKDCMKSGFNLEITHCEFFAFLTKETSSY